MTETSTGAGSADQTADQTAASPTSAEHGDPHLLVLSQHVAAPRELVYEYFTDEAKMLTWMGTAVEIDPRPGGRFWLNATGSDIASGEFVELDPPNRVVFTFGWEGGEVVGPGSTTVTVTLTAADDDTTMVELRQDNLPGGQDDSHNEGWTYFLGRLAIAATGGDPGPSTHG